MVSHDIAIEVRDLAKLHRQSRPAGSFTSSLVCLRGLMSRLPHYCEPPQVLVLQTGRTNRSALTSGLSRRERSQAVTTVFGSLDVGSAIGLLACPPLIRMFGWSSVFSIFAIIGLVWCAIWPTLNPERTDRASPPPPPPSPQAGAAPHHVSSDRGLHHALCCTAAAPGCCGRLLSARTAGCGDRGQLAAPPRCCWHRG